MKNSIQKITLLLLVGVVMLGSSRKLSAQSCRMDAQIMKSNINIPDRVEMGKKYEHGIRVTVTNNGTCTWDGSQHRIRLDIRIARGPSGSGTQRDELTPIVECRGQVPPGKSQEFVYDIEGPYYKGEYTLEWKMVCDGNAFGDVVTKTIEVVPPK